MSIDIRLPQINSATEAGQLQQMKSYLYQLVEQLNWALATIETSGGSGNGAVASTKTSTASQSTDQKESESTFNSIKGLIIKSAEIVDAYYDEINTRLDGLYIARSDFGDYSEETNLLIQSTSNAVDEIFKNVQTIESSLAEIKDSVIAVSAYIRTGLLAYDDSGAPVYGVEVGQTNTVDGVETFNKYARFVSNKLSFFDENDNEVAYISDYKLYIANAEVLTSFKIGGFQSTVQSNGDVVEKWIRNGGNG